MQTADREKGLVDIAMVALPVLCCLLAAALFIATTTPSLDVSSEAAAVDRVRAECDALRAQIEKVSGAVADDAAVRARLADLTADLQRITREAARARAELDRLTADADAVAAARRRLREITDACTKMMADVAGVAAWMNELPTPETHSSGSAEVRK